MPGEREAAPILPYEREDAPEDWKGDSAALCLLTFDVDAESPILAEGEQHARDLSTMSHQAYGPRVGVPRILEVLKRQELQGTFFVPGITAQRWPGTVEAILESGHEVGFHTHMHRPPLRMTPEEEREDFEVGLKALRATGAEPKGFRASYWQLTEVVLEALMEHGFLYDSSLMDDDRPYRLSHAGGRMAELPVHWLMDDWEQYAFLPDPPIGTLLRAPSRVVELWSEELEAMRGTGSLYVLTCHPFVSGRPSRIAALELFIEFAREKGDVGFDRADRLAARVLGDEG